MNYIKNVSNKYSAFVLTMKIAKCSLGFECFGIRVLIAEILILKAIYFKSFSQMLRFLC